jgi:hypothetical protein
MGSTSRYGRATINPSAPEAVGICDRCGKLFDLRALRFQFDWAGTGMINKQLRVCGQCYDLPQEQLRTIILPPDPPPVWQPRIEPYLVDEMNDYTLRAAGMGVPMFRAAGSMTASLLGRIAFEASFSAVGSMTAVLTVPIDYLMTEGGDFLMTEGGDFLITE